MINKQEKKSRTKKRHIRIRKKIQGSEQRPRLAFFKSNKHFYAQLIDDNSGHTLLSCSTLQKSFTDSIKTTWTRDAAKKLGEVLAKSAVEKGIKTVVFDRGGFIYKGKVIDFANSARENGLVF